MRRNIRLHPLSLTLALLAAVGAATPAAAARGDSEPLDLPWREAGWSERAAAAHLLDRFAFGPRPGEVDRVVEIGLATWLEQQLAGDLPDPEVERRLRGLESLEMSTREMVETYPGPGRVLLEASREGYATQLRQQEPAKVLRFQPRL